MVRLSVNVNKVATLRNARGGRLPSVIEAVEACLRAGANGITVHPRADRRHIVPEDVRDIVRGLASSRPPVELNIEGDPRPDLLDLVFEIQPDQCTLVPVAPGEITSQAGWGAGAASERLAPIVEALKARGIRTSLFVDPDREAIQLAADLGADRIELYTEPFARAFLLGPAAARVSYELYAECARVAASLGLGVNAGHDLDLENLQLFADLPQLAEVSIGHALVSRALFVGLETVVREYLAVLQHRPARV
jgi:pyridoxine 5-phosphate synthase